MTLQNLPDVVTEDVWLTARLQLLEREKALTAERDKLNADRRRLPMVKIDKPYRFTGPNGDMNLLDLFEGRSQLVLHHFMFAPEWEDGCPSCSSAADQIPTHLRQLHVRSTSLCAVSRAPHTKLAAYAERMGWTFPWYSSFGSDFNYDFHATLDSRVAPILLHYKTEEYLRAHGTPWDGQAWTDDMNGMEMPGLSCFLRVGHDVYHTYSTFGRGLEEFHNADNYLDLTALGRQEAWEEPKGRAQALELQAGGSATQTPDQYEVIDRQARGVGCPECESRS